MSSQPPETETHEVTLSTAERWVVHYALGAQIDDAIDAGETPPAWTLEVFDAVEGDGTETLTGDQARHLVELLDTYLEADETPYRDIVHGTNVQERLESSLESRS